MVTGMLQVFYIYVYVLLDPEALLSFVNPYIAVSPITLTNSFSMSTPVGKSIISKKVYRNFPITVSQKITLVDLVEL